MKGERYAEPRRRRDVGLGRDDTRRGIDPLLQDPPQGGRLRLLVDRHGIGKKIICVLHRPPDAEVF